MLFLMKAQEIVDVLDAKVYTCPEQLGTDISAACGADLMSDVMAFVKENPVLLTGLLTPQAVRTAELMDIPIVVFVRGKVPTADMMEMATENKMILASTRYSMFIACGRLYDKGLRLGGTREIS